MSGREAGCGARFSRVQVRTHAHQIVRTSIRTHRKCTLLGDTCFQKNDILQPNEFERHLDKRNNWIKNKITYLDSGSKLHQINADSCQVLDEESSESLAHKNVRFVPLLRNIIIFNEPVVVNGFSPGNAVVFAFGLRDCQSTFSDSGPRTIAFAPGYISRRRDVDLSASL
ncbi:hypothetical protein CBL_08224 [Carabus blaptoides fortunei]